MAAIPWISPVEVDLPRWNALIRRHRGLLYRLPSAARQHQERQYGRKFFNIPHIRHPPRPFSQV